MTKLGMSQNPNNGVRNKKTNVVHQTSQWGGVVFTLKISIIDYVLSVYPNADICHRPEEYNYRSHGTCHYLKKEKKKDTVLFNRRLKCHFTQGILWTYVRTWSCLSFTWDLFKMIVKPYFDSVQWSIDKQTACIQIEKWIEQIHEYRENRKIKERFFTGLILPVQQTIIRELKILQGLIIYLLFIDSFS